MNEETDFFDSNAYLSAGDLVNGLMIREGDTDKRNRAVYLYLVKEVFQHLNLSVIRQTERVLLKVNKQLKCITAPDGYMTFSSISVPNEHGKFEPLIINENIDTDIVDLGASKKCGCECGCSSSYCSNIRNYELITSIVPAKMPDGSFQDFTSTTRKKVLQDGRYVREFTRPVEVYESNIHTSTELQTNTDTLCNLELEECGCIKDTKENEQLIFACCDSVSIAHDCGAPVRQLRPDAKFYKISDKGNRIHFPANFPYDTVLLRFYSDRKTKDLRIPYLAAKTVRFGIKAEYTTFNSPGSKENLTWLRLYGLAQIELAEELNKLKLKDFLAHILGTFNVL